MKKNQIQIFNCLNGEMVSFNGITKKYYSDSIELLRNATQQSEKSIILCFAQKKYGEFVVEKGY